MKVTILSLLFFIQTITYSLSKAPESDTNDVVQAPPQFEFFDRKNHMIYYETTPLITCNSNSGRIFIQPVIARNAIDGDATFQLWFDFIPLLDPLGHAKTIDANYIVFSTLRRSIRFPLLYKEQHSNNSHFYTANLSNQKANPRMKGSTLASVNETGYIFLFPEDITNIQSLIVDTKESPNPPWIPNDANRRITHLSELNRFRYYPYRAYSPYVHRLNSNNILGMDAQAIINSEFQGIPEHLPALLQQRAFTITLEGRYGTREWILPPHLLWSITEITQIYIDLLKESN